MFGEGEGTFQKHKLSPKPVIGVLMLPVYGQIDGDA